MRAKIAALLPPGMHVATLDAVEESGANLSRAYRVNLNVLALVALFTGGFLVFSAQALEVARRRREHALLRVLGLDARRRRAAGAGRGRGAGRARRLAGRRASATRLAAAARAHGGRGPRRGHVPRHDAGARVLAGRRARLRRAPASPWRSPARCCRRWTRRARAPAQALKAGDEQAHVRARGEAVAGIAVHLFWRLAFPVSRALERNTGRRLRCRSPACCWEGFF